ncbi:MULTISPECIES: hypothetical protein [Streptomyces]|uniref:hypothetical protein n=1 Tax=Streptomyces TaxID=1883 RepID=UPI00207A1595|nr:MULTISPECIES: hypothetical protein [Streptomyces]MCM9077739.1 hypothetical protein [Streptomyces spororaveus]MCX5307781.1 hypothetical protein [Streptomyces sp. NBC_00160]
MATVAVTGHVNLTGASLPPVAEALRALLARYPAAELTGMSCLAPGADTVFGDAVLALGGRLVAVLPSGDYRARMREGPHAAAFDRLLRAAAEVEVMPYRRAGTDAYAAANRLLLGRAELLVAVWDGGAGGRQGGTGDAVAAARARGIPVEVVWPAGAAREHPARPARGERRGGSAGAPRRRPDTP